MTFSRSFFSLAVAAAGVIGSGTLRAEELSRFDYGFNFKLTAQSIDDLDLGTRDEGDFNGLGLSVRPWIFGARGDWSGFVRGEAFAGTDVLESSQVEGDNLESNDGRERDDSFLALHEFWVDYAGLTAYPGESLRFGRQRIRTPDGMWWDTNIEALRWNFDTTLFNAHLAVAERFSDYRTDLDDLAPQDEDRQHYFGDISTQWRPGHWAGLKLHHSRDNGDLPKPGERVDELSKTYTGDLTWVGAEFNGDFFNPRSTMPLNYWAAATYMQGDAELLQTSSATGERRAVGGRDQDVSGWAVDLGLRWNIDEQWRLGGTYTRASGGGDAEDSDQFLQTDLQSNRSRFTGTRSSLHRFGEAYRGEMNNLQAASLFGSWTMDKRYDASVVYHRFWRVDDDLDSASGLSVGLEPGEKDLGEEVDLVLTRYFDRSELGWAEAESALVRLRGGVFLPGDAFPSGTDSSMHRVFLDLVWRY
ncbi:alginate export family protein [Pseudomonas sp. BMS12]|uniref:alginate export family protein n=1 Tax=Pseudomonas sp. BMS12 TaxID=1796033 RepID=UPI00083AF9D0|nr:alginate export family protein [Pseudomonas sp. BMS12]